MTIMKFKFIESLKDEKKRDENIVKMTVTKVIILEFKELLVDAKMFLTLMNEMKKKMKWDWWCLSCWNSSLISKNAWTH